MNQARIKTVEHVEELMPIMTEALQNGNSVRFAPSGTSMMPMLRQGIDSVVLSPVTARLKKYDIPLYRQDGGKYVLHRIVKVSEDYTCMGDNQFLAETGVRHDQVIAVVTAFYRNEKRYSVTQPWYQMYCRIWYHSRQIRKIAKRAVNRIRRNLA